MKKLLLPSLLVFALTGCPSDPNTQGSSDDGTNAGNNTVVKGVDAKSPTSADGLPTRFSDPSRNSVYFDYDSYVIRAEARPLIEDHAKFLTQQPNRRLTIQGNADDRGSREYNLALGQKRAEAVRRALKLQGANDNQIEAVSLGKEHPRCTQYTETCYAENRRGDLVYLR